MKFRFSLIIPILLMTIISSSITHPQNFESDPEVGDIRSRVIEVTWELDINTHYWSDSTINDTFIGFRVELELWNPHNRDLVSYGSSS